jgi:hypothetical protein
VLKREEIFCETSECLILNLASEFSVIWTTTAAAAAVAAATLRNYVNERVSEQQAR